MFFNIRHYIFQSETLANVCDNRSRGRSWGLQHHGSESLKSVRSPLYKTYSRKAVPLSEFQHGKEEGAWGVYAPSIFTWHIIIDDIHFIHLNTAIALLLFTYLRYFRRNKTFKYILQTGNCGRHYGMVYGQLMTPQPNPFLLRCPLFRGLASSSNHSSNDSWHDFWE